MEGWEWGGIGGVGGSERWGRGEDRGGVEGWRREWRMVMRMCAGWFPAWLCDF